MYIKFINSINWFILLGIVLGRYMEALFILIVQIILLLREKKIVLSKTLIPLIFIFLSSIFLIYINSYSPFKFIQQFLFIFVVFYSYVQYFEIVKPDIESLFKKYIQLMYVLCLLGLIQFVFFLFFRIDIFPYSLDGYVQNIPNDKIIRIHSILNEAGNLGTCLVPVIAYMLFDNDFFKKNKKKSIVIIITYFLTLATIAYVMLFILLIIKLYTKLKYLKYVFIALFIAVVPFLFSILNKNVESMDRTSEGFFGAMQRKVIETTSFFELEDPTAFELLNISSYTTLTNLWIATNAPCRLTGTGLGTHQENYEKLYPPNDFQMYGLNKADGYSLFIRILSEFGILGIVFYFIFLIKFANKNNIVNISVFFLLLALLIRGGHYTLYGTVFFHLLYFYTSKRYKWSVNNNR